MNPPSLLSLCAPPPHTLRPLPAGAAATINFSRLGARAFISKTAKTSAKVYFKSTVAGLHPDDQAAGQRLPVKTAAAGAPAAAGPSTAAVAGGVPAAAAAAGASFTRSEGSPYPPGPAAAAAAAVGAAPAYPPYPAK